MYQTVRSTSRSHEISTAGDQALKLCLAAESFYPVYAGPAVRFARYLPGFAARDVQVRVITATPNPVRAAMSGLAERRNSQPGQAHSVEMIHGVPVHRVRVPLQGWRRPISFGRALLRLCREPQFRPDVIQLLSLSFAHLPFLGRLRHLGIPIVFTKTMVAELPRASLKQLLLRRYLLTPLERVDCVVVSSGLMAQSLRRLGVTTRIEVIPNGVSVQRFRPPASIGERQLIRGPLGIGATDLAILFVGPVSPRKGVDLLLEAWQRLAPDQPRVHLVIVGPRKDQVDPEQAAFRLKLEGLLSERGAAARTHFVGLVDNVEDYMRAADLFVFTSRREGMPNVIPEAMASGLPVVTTPFVGLPTEFGRPDREYLLADFNSERLADVIEQVLRDKEVRLQFARSGRAWAEREMNVERSLDQYVELYRAMTANARAVRPDQ